MTILARWVTSIDGLRELGPRYDAMVLAAGDAGLFYQLGWLERAWPYYHARLGGTLTFLVAEQHGEPVALAPLVLVTKRWTHARQRVLGFIGGTWDELDNWMPAFLVATRQPGEQADVLDVLAESLAERHWDLLDLRLVRDSCPSHKALRKRFPGLRSTLDRNTTPRARLEGGWAAYWSGRSKRLMRILERGKNRAAGDGLRVVHEVTPGVPIERRGEVEAIHRARQDRIRTTGKLRSSPFEDADARQVFWSLTDWAAARGQLRAHWLWLGDRVAAYVLVLHHAGTSFGFFNAIDPAAERYHPGSLILAEMIRQEAENHGAVVIDMMVGTNLTKSLFATEELALRRLSVVNPRQHGSWAKNAWIRIAREFSQRLRR